MVLPRQANLAPTKPAQLGASLLIVNTKYLLMPVSKQNRKHVGAFQMWLKFILYQKVGCQVKYINLLSIAPGTVTALPESPVAVKATVVPATDSAGVTRYIIQIKDHTEKNCTTTVPTLSCTIPGLSPAVEYTVQTEACLAPNSGPNPCSALMVGGKTWTNPSSKSLAVV